MKKIYYKIYARQTTTKLAAGDVDTGAKLITEIIGSDGSGKTSFATNSDYFALVGENGVDGLAEVDAAAFMRGELGDRQPLAGGENPVISEKMLAELISFDVNGASWSTAAESGAIGAMPLRKRLSTNVTGVNIDLAFIDVRAVKAIAGTYQNKLMWDVPFYVGLDVVAGEPDKHPCSVEKEVSQLEEELDVYPCVVS